jgi:hypothetical protein
MRLFEYFQPISGFFKLFFYCFYYILHIPVFTKLISFGFGVLPPQLRLGFWNSGVKRFTLIVIFLESYSSQASSDLFVSYRQTLVIKKF